MLGLLGLKTASKASESIVEKPTDLKEASELTFGKVETIDRHMAFGA